MRAHKKQFIEWTLLIVLWLSAIPGLEPRGGTVC